MSFGSRFMGHALRPLTASKSLGFVPSDSGRPLLGQGDPEELRDQFERCLRQLEAVLDQIEEHEAIMEAGGRGGYHWSEFTSPTIIEQLKQRAENMKKKCDDLEEQIGQAEAIQVICDAAMGAYEDALTDPGTDPPTRASFAGLTDDELIAALKKCCEALNVWAKVKCRLEDCIALMYGWTGYNRSLYDPQHGEHGVAARKAADYQEGWNACIIFAEYELRRRGCKVTINNEGVECKDGIMTEGTSYTGRPRSGLLKVDCDADCPKPGEAPKIPAFVPEQWWEKGFAMVPSPVVAPIPAPVVPARPVAAIPAAVPMPPILPQAFDLPAERPPAVPRVPQLVPKPPIVAEEEAKAAPGAPIPKVPLAVSDLIPELPFAVRPSVGPVALSGWPRHKRGQR